MNDFYTAEDVAGILKLKKYTVYEIIKRGELPCTRLGKQIRVAKEDLEQYCGARKKKNGSRQPAVTPDAAALITLAPDGARPANFVIAGQDYCLDILLSHMPPSVNGSVLRSYTGSYNSLFELYRGTISAAAVHLWDGETDTYNAPFVRRLLPGVECGILRLAGGTQGLYVKKK